MHIQQLRCVSFKLRAHTLDLQASLFKSFPKQPINHIKGRSSTKSVDMKTAERGDSISNKQLNTVEKLSLPHTKYKNVTYKIT